MLELESFRASLFQVFFSARLFSTNVMVKVATRPAENPVCIVPVLYTAWFTGSWKARKVMDFLNIFSRPGNDRILLKIVEFENAVLFYR